VVCATAITAGGAVEVRNLTDKPAPPRERSSSDRSGSAPRAAAPSTAAAPARTRSGTAAAFPTPSAAFRAQRDHAVHGGAPVAVEKANGAPKSGSFVLDGESPALVDDAPQVASGVSAEPGPQPQQQQPQQQNPEPAQQQPAETGTVSEPVISVPPVSASPVAELPAPDAHAPDVETPADPSVGLELETAPATPVEP
jgi:hypothetical protein